MEASGNNKKRHYYHPKKHNGGNGASQAQENRGTAPAQPNEPAQQTKPGDGGTQSNQRQQNGNRRHGNRDRRDNRPPRDANGINAGRPTQNQSHRKPEYMKPAFEEPLDSIPDDYTPPITGESRKPALDMFESEKQNQQSSKPGVIPGPEVLEDIPKVSYAAVDAVNGSDAGKVRVVGIQFNAAGKVYYFDPGELHPAAKSHVIVETARGPEYGEVVNDERLVSEGNVVRPLRPVIRIATPEDDTHDKENRAKEDDAFKICAEKIQRHQLDMKLVDAQYTFDNSKLLFYFTSAGRVDFRELVKDLAGVFRTRIELRQIGIRDEAKMMGGLGACGRPLCCASFLADFVQVSIKMAKEQNLSLNSGKISGCCGRLMCCLRYEYESYEAELKLLPPLGSKVKTPDGVGFVTELLPMIASVKVSVAGQQQDSTVIKTYPKEAVTVLFAPAHRAEDADDGDSDNIEK